MLEMAKWIDRKFPERPAPDTFPMLVERLAGTPARLEERIGAIPEGLLTKRTGESWSILEHAGHLGDVEWLWLARFREFLAGEPELTAADMSNQKTDGAAHNDRPVAETLLRFRSQRGEIVSLLEDLEGPDVVRSALHPRLNRPMRLIDLCSFVAEHDDHHLARIRGIWRLSINR